MATKSINDWVIEASFSTSKAEKQMKKFEGRLQKIANVEAKISKSQSVAITNQNKALQKQNQLEAQRLSLRKKINQAEQLGIRDLKKERGALGGTNPVKIRAQILALDKQITAERKKQQAAEAKRRAEEKASVAAAKSAASGRAAVKQVPGFILPFDRQEKLRNTIDSVVRRAKAGLGETSDKFQEINNRAEKLRGTVSKIGSRVELERLNNGIRRLREETTTATSATRRLNSQLERQRFVARATSDSIRNFGRAYVSVFAAIEAGRFVFNTVKQFDSLNASLLASSGNAAQAAKDFKFIERTSISLGVRLSDVADGWRQIGAAGRFSNLTVDQTKDVFLAATEASRAFGLSADRTSLVYLAFSQILSKGKVSQEELRRQLGEQLPGAMAIAAKAMNVTTSELEQMIQKGISAEEFLPKFAAELRRSVRDGGALSASLNTVAAAQERLSTQLQLGIKDFSGAGGREGIVDILEGLTFVVESLRPVFTALGIVFRKVGRDVRTIARIFGGLVNIITSLVKAFQALSPETEKTADGLEQAKNEAVGFLAIYEAIASVADRVLGVVQLTVGLFERLAKGEFKSIATDFQKISGAKVSEGTSPFSGVVGQAIPGIGNLFSAAEIASKFARRNDQTSNVNSGNTLNATINVPSGDPETVRRTLDSWWQDTMKVGI